MRSEKQEKGGKKKKRSPFSEFSVQVQSTRSLTGHKEKNCPRWLVMVNGTVKVPVRTQKQHAVYTFLLMFTTHGIAVHFDYF